MENIYARLMRVRNTILQENETFKSGSNLHLKFKYYELKDFIPRAMKLFEENNICSVFCLEKEKATLTLHDMQESESKQDPIVFEIYTGERNEANLMNNLMSWAEGNRALITEFKDVMEKGWTRDEPAIKKMLLSATEKPYKDFPGVAMQSIGASNTYLKRYLYLNALELCEQDEIEKTLGESESKYAPQNKYQNSFKNSENKYSPQDKDQTAFKDLVDCQSIEEINKVLSDKSYNFLKIWQDFPDSCRALLAVHFKKLNATYSKEHNGFISKN